ncbi:ADP-ribose pyrophosphatase [Kocuria polaris]|nr:ADP-ribose pyrophosphatase [Kocuria polaris]
MPVPDFILRLRERIGTDPLWLSGVTAVVLRGDGRDEVLLVRRSDNGAWTPVTGIVDPGEHPARTAVREAAEETGVEVEVEALAWVSVTDPVVHVNGDRAQYLDHTFRCRFVSGEPYPADDESTAAGWFRLDDLPPMREIYRERIRTAVEHTGSTRLD